MIYKDNSSPCFDKFIYHYAKYLTNYDDINIIWLQPVCHYVVPLLGRIKTNAM